MRGNCAELAARDRPDEGGKSPSPSPGERTFSWFGRNRCLAKHFENLAETLATFVTLASIQLGPQAVRQGGGRELNRPPFCIAR
jgi:hypothetical protein